jgi:hypothetical protein
MTKDRDSSTNKAIFDDSKKENPLYPYSHNDPANSQINYLRSDAV